MRLRTDVLGALNLFNTHQAPRDDEDLRLAQSLADGWRNGAVKAFERQLAELR